MSRRIDPGTTYAWKSTGHKDLLWTYVSLFIRFRYRWDKGRWRKIAGSPCKLYLFSWVSEIIANITCGHQSKVLTFFKVDSNQWLLGRVLVFHLLSEAISMVSVTLRRFGFFGGWWTLFSTKLEDRYFWSI